LSSFSAGEGAFDSLLPSNVVGEFRMEHNGFHYLDSAVGLYTRLSVAFGTDSEDVIQQRNPSSISLV